MRKRAAEVQKNPQLLSIEMRTFRHWGGTMLAHYTNGKRPDHKKVPWSQTCQKHLKYIRMLHFTGDQYDVTTATTVEEAKQILSTSFD